MELLLLTVGLLAASTGSVRELRALGDRTNELVVFEAKSQAGAQRVRADSTDKRVVTLERELAAERAARRALEKKLVKEGRSRKQAESHLANERSRLRRAEAEAANLRRELEESERELRRAETTRKTTEAAPNEPAEPDDAAARARAERRRARAGFPQTGSSEATAAPSTRRREATRSDDDLQKKSVARDLANERQTVSALRERLDQEVTKRMKVQLRLAEVMERCGASFPPRAPEKADSKAKEEKDSKGAGSR